MLKLIMNLSVLKMKKIASNFISYLLLLFITGTQAQSIYGGIEIGDKGVKMYVINVQNTKSGTFEIQNFWTENVETASGMPINGNLAQQDIDTAGSITLKNYKKMLTEYKIENQNIYIAASSRTAMAHNIGDLAKKVKTLTNKDLDIITSSLEAKLLSKGCIPPKNYLNSLVLDIGERNTKGGYINAVNGANIFYPITVDIGTITLTEKIIKRNKQKPSLDYNQASFDYLPTLREEFDTIYSNRPESIKKENIYLSGGALWAFYTLFNEKSAANNFTEIRYEDIVLLKFIIENNFEKIVKISLTNPHVKEVLDTYSQKNLIASNSILLTALEEIPNIKNKKIFFAKQGEIAWLISFIMERSKGSIQVY
ncbi:Ppx/GppA phosphatase family protein [Flavobacterium collinsii]|uniref:Ppx/GppA phosphatase family protein n=1 Tax=Flavobacterium collinsii TaxID=1114861 RepID=UPI0021DFB70D|nr:exopolyphosphatase [Flavobacterium collinsii]